MITIKINTDNDSFGVSCADTAEEVNRILKDAIYMIEQDSYELFNQEEEIVLRDNNGNRVGEVRYSLMD